MNIEITAREVAEYLGGSVEGNPDVILRDFSSIENGRADTLSFLSNMQYKHFIYTTECGAVLVNNSFEATEPISTTLIRVPNAYTALADLLKWRDAQVPVQKGISPLAFVDESAQVDESAYVAPFAVVGAHTVIGEDVRIMPHACVGDGCKIGNGSVINSNVVLYARTIIGARCIIHSGAVIGADGFGFAPDENGYHKIPQTGRVILEDDVEIGANACIDRAVLDATIIRKGVKIDNLVQIGHNSEVKEHTAIAAQSGIAGSTTIGPWNVLAGQVGVAGHLKTAKGVTLAAQTGVLADIKEEDSTWFGYPAQPHLKAMKASAKFIRLPEMDKEIYRIGKELEELKERIEKLNRDDR